ncbi:MAG: tetratricopeptide repeat protein [bacterium]|nr:tetratricopeptide repeat protein [bacterium]
MRRLLILLWGVTWALAGFCAMASDDSGNQAMDQFIQGTIADEMGDYYRAIFHYQEALRYDSTSAFVYVALSQDYALLGKPDIALELLDRALALQNNFLPALELKLVLLQGMDANEDARSVLKGLIQALPRNTDYLRQLLAVDLQLGHYDEADVTVSQIADVDSSRDLLMRQVVAVYLAAGETERAIHWLEIMIAADSSDAALIFALGTSCLQLGDTTHGELLIRRANAMDPSVARYWIARAYLMLNRDDNEGTLMVLDSALMQAEPVPTLFNLQATALNRLQRAPEAVEALRRSLAIDSSSFATMGTLALVYDEMDSLNQAIEWYERALVLSDSAPLYLNNLAYTYAVRGVNLEHARQLVEKALLADPDNGAYLDTMGWIEYGLGRYRSALTWLRRAQRTPENSASTLEHIGDVYWKLGSRKKAVKYYRDALHLDPSSESLQKKLLP